MKAPPQNPTRRIRELSRQRLEVCLQIPSGWRVILSDQQGRTARSDHRWQGKVHQRTHRSKQERKTISADGTVKVVSYIRPFVLFTLHPSTLRFWKNPNPRFLSWGREATNTRERNREETHRTSLLTTMRCLEQAHTGEGRDLILNEFQSFDYYIWLDILINERMQFCDEQKTEELTFIGREQKIHRLCPLSWKVWGRISPAVGG